LRGGCRHANRLAASTSPYLLQHQDNPVDWWEWSPEAFAEAERAGVPVLLSIGYAACHWCHVMAHESFEDDDTRAYMNEHFVNVKVDREERPGRRRGLHGGRAGDDRPRRLADDQLPHAAGRAVLLRHLLAAGAPGTGMPSFREVLQSVSQTWETRRGEVEAAGADVVQRLSRAPGGPTADVTPELLDRAFAGPRAGGGGDERLPITNDRRGRPQPRAGRHAAPHLDASAGEVLGALPPSGCWPSVDYGCTRHRTVCVADDPELWSRRCGRAVHAGPDQPGCALGPFS
jgi:hypothetical protein